MMLLHLGVKVNNKVIVMSFQVMTSILTTDIDGVNMRDVAEQSGSSSGNSTSDAQINVGDWYIVNYDGVKYPGEVTAIGDEDDFRVSVMQPAGKQYWKWPDEDDNIFYRRDKMIKKLDKPEVVNSRGQYKFSTKI